MTDTLRRWWSGRPSAAESRAALRLLGERRWLQAFGGVVLLSLVFCGLGAWQWNRHDLLQTRARAVAANYSAEPAPLERILAGSQLPADLQWRRAIVTGRYLPSAQLLVRNRPYEGQAGYQVLVPLETGNAVLFVDRGWVPAGRTAARPDAVPPPPSGPVRVVARLRPPEPSDGRTAPADQTNRVDVATLVAALPPGSAGRIVNAYGVLESEDPAPATRPVAARPPPTGLGINLAYALQWWAFALTGYVLLGLAMVREVRRGAGQ